MPKMLPIGVPISAEIIFCTGALPNRTEFVPPNQIFEVPFPPRMAQSAKNRDQTGNRVDRSELYASLKFHQQGRHLVDLALKLNVLAVCAVFVFVGAILLGAF
jgi:hypothetical protein